MFKFGDMSFDSREDAQAWCDERLRYASNDPSVLRSVDYVGYRSKAPPFCDMDVGDRLVFDMPIPYIQQRAHSYGHYHGRKFKTWQEWPCLIVERVA